MKIKNTLTPNKNYPEPIKNGKSLLINTGQEWKLKVQLVSITENENVFVQFYYKGEKNNMQRWRKETRNFITDNDKEKGTSKKLRGKRNKQKTEMTEKKVFQNAKW